VSIPEFWSQFVADLKQTSLLEFVAVISGIASVWLSRIENIWVYPTGLANTIIYIYLSFKSSLIGEASVNFYYTVVSIYGWVLWARKNAQQQHILHVTWSSRKEWAQEMAFFGFFFIGVFFALTFL
jgi:nicotinamide mononucleotide transporter